MVAAITKPVSSTHTEFPKIDRRQLAAIGVQVSRTPSFTVDRDLLDHSDHDPSATLSDDDCFLYEKYHSLYSCEDAGDDFTYKSPRYDEDPSPTVFCWTKRFFVSPATSNSLLRDARPSTVASSSLPSCSSSCTSDLEPNT
ncbi:hypothetical protein BHE74_00058645 [Ensete ventricosum]|nr:hypothetical protein BHE74_00058645 [Ensete ventricosum]